MKRHSATNLSNSRNSTIIQDWIPEGIGKFLELPASTLVSWYGSVVPLETVLLPNLAGQTRAALLLPAITVTFSTGTLYGS